MHYDPMCSKGEHKCEKVCVSPECEIKNPFVCSTCLNQHRHCPKVITYRDLIKTFHSLQGLNKKEISKYEQDVQKTFKQLMTSLKEEFTKFREEMEHFNISKEIKEIYYRMKAQKEDSLTGKQIAEAMLLKPPDMIDFKPKLEVEMRIIRNQIIEMQQKVKERLPYYYSLKHKFVECDVDCEEVNVIKNIEDKYVTKRKDMTGMLIGKQDAFSIFEKMVGKDVYNVQLLYRATQHEFSAEKFHECCDGYTNTLTMAETQFGKVVGGFYSKAWRKTPKWQYFQEKPENCFLFSLSKKLRGIKLTPRKGKFAIGMHSSYGPSFGDDFVIYQKANTSHGCWSNFPDVYNNKENTFPHAESLVKEFVGVNDHFQKFNLTQWEVYKISFNAQQQLKSKVLELYDQI